MLKVLLCLVPLCSGLLPSLHASRAVRGGRLEAVADVALAAGIASAPSTVPSPVTSLPSVTLAKTETREGIYGEYQITVPDRDQPVDDARSTFKTRAQTKKNKNKYVGIFAVLLVGSFIIPMVQYFWYVRDEPGSLFGPKQRAPPPPPPKKKNFWER